MRVGHCILYCRFAAAAIDVTFIAKIMPHSRRRYYNVPRRSTRTRAAQADSMTKIRDPSFCFSTANVRLGLFRQPFEFVVPESSLYTNDQHCSFTGARDSRSEEMYEDRLHNMTNVHRQADGVFSSASRPTRTSSSLEMISVSNPLIALDMAAAAASCTSTVGTLPVTMLTPWITRLIASRDQVPA